MITTCLFKILNQVRSIEFNTFIINNMKNIFVFVLRNINGIIYNVLFTTTLKLFNLLFNYLPILYKN